MRVLGIRAWEAALGIRAATVLAGMLLAVPAFAQSGVNLLPESASKTDEEKEQDAVREKAYRESLRKIPDTKTTADPWGGVRNADAPKTSTPAKPKTKTGSNVRTSQ